MGKVTQPQPASLPLTPLQLELCLCLTLPTQQLGVRSVVFFNDPGTMEFFNSPGPMVFLNSPGPMVKDNHGQHACMWALNDSWRPLGGMSHGGHEGE